MTRDDIAKYTATEPLRDERLLKIRAIRADDKAPVVDALRAVSADSLYRRFFSAKKEFSEAELKQITEVDFVDVVALVAVLDEAGTDTIVGGGRYFRFGGSEAPLKAEVAFLVDDAHHGLGIGSRIFKHLVAIALASGITRFEAEVLPFNDGMLRLFDRSGLPVAKTVADGVVHVTIHLSTKDAPARVAGGPASLTKSGGRR